MYLRNVYVYYFSRFDKLRSSMCELPLNEDKVAIAEVRALPSTAERPTSKSGK